MKSLVRLNSDNDLIAIIPENVLYSWSKLYAIDYVKRELIRIYIWHEANPKKNNRTARGWIQFTSNWLERGWNDYLKNIPTNKPAGFGYRRPNEPKPIKYQSADEVFAEQKKSRDEDKPMSAEEKKSINEHFSRKLSKILGRIKTI